MIKMNKNKNKLLTLVLVFSIMLSSGPGVVFGFNFEWETNRGSVVPKIGEKTIYTAPFQTGGDEIRARISGEDNIEEGKADISVVPPYELSCASGETSINIYWTSQWNDPNYLDHGYGAHGWALYEDPNNVLKNSSVGGSDFYNHTGLEENALYSYTLKVQYWDYQESNMSVSCRTGTQVEPPLPTSCVIVPYFARTTYGYEQVFRAQTPEGSPCPSFWYVNENLGGNSDVGTIDTTPTSEATYRAPFKSGSFNIEARGDEHSANATVIVRNPYSLRCYPEVDRDNEEYKNRLVWEPFGYPDQGNHDSHTVTLYHDSNELITPTSWNRGSYLHENLEEGKLYNYRLSMRYTSGPASGNTFNFYVSCSALTLTEDAPSNLNAFAYDDGTIFVNWKDNVTNPDPNKYSFEVQKIKATPEKSEDFTVEKDSNSPSTGLNLNWRNSTFSTPYYHEVQYATRPDFSDIIETKKNVIHNNASVDEIKPTPGTKANQNERSFSLKLENLEPGKGYYIRQRTCSGIDFPLGWPYTQNKPERILNLDLSSRPKPPCSAYIPEIGTYLYIMTNPNIPGNLNISDIKHDSLKINWSFSGNVDGFEIERRFVPGGQWEVINNNLSGSLRTFNNGGLSPETQYQYRIRSFVNDTVNNEKVYSNYSEAISATTKPLPLPVVSMSADPSSVYQGGNFLLSWSSTGADSCQVSGGWSGPKSLSGDENIFPASSETYTIRCTNQYGSAERSVYVTVQETIFPDPPGVPLLISPSDGSLEVSTNPILSWQSVDGADSYRLEISKNSNFTSLEYSVEHENLWAQVGLEENEYYWRVNAINQAGPGQWSSVWSFRTKYGDGPGPEPINIVDNINSLRSLSQGSFNEVEIRGYYVPDDGGQGVFRWNQNLTAIDNGGTIIAPDTNPSQGRWVRDTTQFDYYNARWFGANPSQNTNGNESMIQRTLDAAASAGVLKVFIPVGIYDIKNDISINETHTGLELFGSVSRTRDSENNPIVNTSNSSIIRVAPGLPASQSTGILTVRDSRENRDSINPVLMNLKISNLGLDGNRYVNRWDPDETRSSAHHHNILLWTQNRTDHIEINNVYSYNAHSNGVQVYADNVTIQNFVTHNVRAHGISQRSKNLTIKNVIAYRNAFELDGTPRGFYGVSLSGGGVSENVLMDGFEIYENSMGTKIPNTKNITIKNGTYRDNYHTGLTSGGGQYGSNLFLDNVASIGNGSNGFRFGDLFVNIKIGKIIAEDNGKIDKNSSNIIIHNTVLGTVEIDELVSKNYNGDSYSTRLRKNMVIDNLIVHDNKGAGVEITENMTIKSGRIYNNNNAGIYITGTKIVELHNIKFGSSDDPEPYRQIYREIYDNGSATLRHKGLDFSDSKVSPSNQIRVSQVEEIAGFFEKNLLASVNWTTGAYKNAIFNLKNIINSIYKKMTSWLGVGIISLAQDNAGDSYKEYFLKAKEGGLPIPYYKDEDVDPDSVYIYRVRAVYSDNTVSSWSDEVVAVKSLRDTDGGEIENNVRGICLRNSFCDRTIDNIGEVKTSSSDPVLEESEQQCTFNLHCRDVGRSDIRIEER